MGEPVNFEEVCRQIKERLMVRAVNDACFVMAVSIHGDPHVNSLHKIYHHRSTPLGGICHNAYDECYHVECCNFVALGYIPMSFMVEVEGNKVWESRVPIPEAVIHKLLSPDQLRDLQQFKAMHGDDPVRYEYFQFIDCLSEEPIC